MISRILTICNQTGIIHISVVMNFLRFQPLSLRNLPKRGETDLRWARESRLSVNDGSPISLIARLWIASKVLRECLEAHLHICAQHSRQERIWTFENLKLCKLYSYNNSYPSEFFQIFSKYNFGIYNLLTLSNSSILTRCKL